MDIREMIEKCKPFAPVVSAAVVAACVAGSLYGYEAPVYEMKASVEDTQEQEDEVPVVKTSTEKETKEDEAAEEEEQDQGDPAEIGGEGDGPEDGPDGFLRGVFFHG